MSQVVKNGGVGTSPSIDKINKVPSEKLVAAEMCKSVFYKDKIETQIYPLVQVDLSEVKEVISMRVDSFRKADIKTAPSNLQKAILSKQIEYFRRDG